MEKGNAIAKPALFEGTAARAAMGEELLFRAVRMIDAWEDNDGDPVALAYHLWKLYGAR